MLSKNRERLVIKLFKNDTKKGLNINQINSKLNSRGNNDIFCLRQAGIFMHMRDTSYCCGGYRMKILAFVKTGETYIFTKVE